MALKSGTPVNLSALRQDYSMLPQIAAVKAQANQQLFNTISEGIEKRKQKKIEADEKASNIKVIERVLNSPLGERVFGQDRPSAEDVYSSMGKGGQGELVKLLTTMQNAEIAQTEEKRRLALLQVEQQKTQMQDAIDNAKRLLRAEAMTSTGAERFTPEALNIVSQKTGIPVNQLIGLGAETIREINLFGRKRLDELSKNDPNFKKYVTSLATLPAGTTLQDDLINPTVFNRVLQGAIGGGAAGLVAGGGLFSLPASVVGTIGGAIGGGAYGMVEAALRGKKEFEAGVFDLPQIREYNEILRRNPEILQAAGAPQNVYNLINIRMAQEDAIPAEGITLRDGTTVEKRDTDQPAPENNVPEKINKEEKGISEKKRKSLEEKYLGTF